MSLVKKLAVQTAPNVTNTYDIGADAQNVDYGTGNVKTKLDSVVDKSTIAPVETSTTASASYAIGDHFILNNDFCTVTAAISAGDTLVEDTNYTVAPLVDSLGGDTSNFIKKSNIAGLVKNDGMIDTNTYATTSQLPDITGKADKVNDATSGDLVALYNDGNIYDSGIAFTDVVLSANVHNIPSGGTAGQVLAKNSGTDYDAGWITPSGGGSSVKKTRYTITSSSWSASANASGYYTYSLTLNPTLSTSFCPDVELAGQDNNTLATVRQANTFKMVNYFNLTASNTLVLYAKSKPTQTFYIWVMGENS